MQSIDSVGLGVADSSTDKELALTKWNSNTNMCTYIYIHIIVSTIESLFYHH